MDDDPIGEALAIALDAIDEHASHPRYRDPILAVRIARVRAELEELQLHIDSVANTDISAELCTDQTIQHRAQ